MNKKGDCSRREALTRLAKLAALSAGLGAAGTKRLVAQVARIQRKAVAPPDVTKLIGIKANDKNAKALKVMLMPRSKQAEVFASEFGHRPVFQATARGDKGFGCRNYIGLGGSCRNLDCGIHICNGETCSFYANYGPNDPSFDEVFSGDCGDKCAAYCGSHCAGHGRPCWFNKVHINLGEVKSQWLREVNSDPFIQALFKELKLTDPAALEVELVKLLNQRRLG